MRPEDAFVFDVLVQVATLLAVFTYFWRDIISIVSAVSVGIRKRSPFKDPMARLGWLLILGTVPAGVFGLILEEAVERAFASPTATGAALLFTAGLLVAAERTGERNRSIDKLNWVDALWIGFFQVLAIFPGVSRSGTTITGGMTRDLDRPAAARFAFLMSIPIMLAAGLLASLDLVALSQSSPGNPLSLLSVFVPGFIAAAFVGYMSIRWLLRYLMSNSLYIFAFYCAVLGSLVLVVSLLR
jgi:undecaprenyl-diphosphatase